MAFLGKQATGTKPGKMVCLDVCHSLKNEVWHHPFVLSVLLTEICGVD